MKMISRRSFLKTVAAASTVAGLAACGASSSSVAASSAAPAGDASSEAAAPTNFDIRVGTMPYYSGVPLQVIMDEGLDKKYGFNMTIVDFAGGGPMAEALGAGEWDIGPIGAGGMTAIGNYNAKVLADVEVEMDGAWMMARPDSDIATLGSTLADFPDVFGDAETVKGKTILGTIGNISHYMAIDYCSKFDLTLADVNFLNMDTNNVYTAFVAGQGDIACMGSPTAAMKLLNEGYVRVGGLLQQGQSQQDCMICSEDYYANHREEAVVFMTAWLEAVGMINADSAYEEEKTSKFYTDRGRTDFTEDDVKQECGFNKYLDADNAADNVTGAWMTNLISCYVDAEVMEQATLDAMKTNVMTDVLEDAIAALNA